MVGTMPAPRTPSQPVGRSAWFESPLALGLMQETQRQVIPLLTSHIGVRGLYLRPSPAVSPLLSGNMLQSTISVHADSAYLDGDLRCRVDALPIEADSLSLVYALHVLEVVAEPAELLAECARALRPEGVLFAICLSTTSPWRLRWMGGRLQPMNERRLRAMLQGAGLSIEQSFGLGPAWPRLSSHDPGDDARHSRWVPDALRAALLLVARKRRAGLTPLLPRAQKVPLGSHAHAG